MNFNGSQSKEINANLLAQLSKVYPEELNNSNKHKLNYSPNSINPENNIATAPFTEFMVPNSSIERRATPDSFGPPNDFIKESLTPEFSGHIQGQGFDEMIALNDYSRKRNRTLSSGTIEGIYNQNNFNEYSSPAANNPTVFSSFLKIRQPNENFCSPLSTIPNLYGYDRSQPFMANVLQKTYLTQNPDYFSNANNLLDSDNIQNLGQYPGTLNYFSTATSFDPNFEVFPYDKPSDDVVKALEFKPFDKENLPIEDILDKNRNKSGNLQSFDLFNLGPCKAQFEPPLVDEPKKRRHSMPDSNAELNSESPRKQMLRFDNDLYTPKWVRFSGSRKEGLCELCPEKKWLQLKNSAYWYFINLKRYHLQFSHGISSVSGSQFKSPEEIRVLWTMNMTERISSQTLPANILVEGLCHHCNEWKPLNRNKKKYSWNYNSMEEVKTSILATGTLLPNNASDQTSTVKIIASFHDNQDMIVPVGMDIPQRVLDEIKDNLNSSGSSIWWKHCHKCHLSSTTQ